MNIFALSLEMYKENCFYFLDTKPNMIMDGIFTKIIFTHSCFTLNGVYFKFPIMHQSIEHVLNKQDYLYFEPSNKLNIPILRLCKLMEKTILQCYSNYKGNFTRKTPIHSIAKQLNSGKCKIQLCNNHKMDKILKSLVIKISGIWETPTEYGITYKIMEQSD